MTVTRAGGRRSDAPSAPCHGAGAGGACVSTSTRDCCGVWSGCSSSPSACTAPASHGGRRSKKRGTSVEFADYREYAHGDDLRQIDWNVYGRSDRLFVKLREDEESFTVHLLVDCSRAWTGGDTTSCAYARRLAAALGYAAPGRARTASPAGFSERLLTSPCRRCAARARRGACSASSRPAARRPDRPQGAPCARTPLMHRRSGLAMLDLGPAQSRRPGGPHRPPRPRLRGRADPHPRSDGDRSGRRGRGGAGRPRDGARPCASRSTRRRWTPTGAA